MRLTSLLLVRNQGVGKPASDGRIRSNLAKWSTQFANLPERYLLRKTRRILYKPPVPHPAFANEIDTTRIPDFTLERPWSDRAPGPRYPGQFYVHGVFAEPIPDREWMWFRGDRVEILKGKDKGKQGYINYVVQERNWVCVEGLNCKYVKVGASEKFPGIMQMEEQPLTVPTDVRLVDPGDEKATNVEWRYTEDGERVRVSVRTGRQLPIPTEAFETVDYKTPSGYAPNKYKDTKAKDVEEITYEPSLATFEMDIMRKHGIKEDRDPAPTFWY